MSEAEETEEKTWTWDIDLEPLIGAYVRIETHESMYRSGRLSDVQYREMPMCGRTIKLPEGLEMNGDKTDIIPFSLVKNIELV